MTDTKVEFYESLVRLSIMLIFMFALVVGTFGLVSVCHMLVKSQMSQNEFVTRDLS